MVVAYDSGTTRANEMLTVLDAILPLFLKQIVQDKKTEVTVLICFFLFFKMGIAIKFRYWLSPLTVLTVIDV